MEGKIFDQLDYDFYKAAKKRCSQVFTRHHHFEKVARHCAIRRQYNNIRSLSTPVARSSLTTTSILEDLPHRLTPGMVTIFPTFTGSGFSRFLSWSGIPLDALQFES